MSAKSLLALQSSNGVFVDVCEYMPDFARMKSGLLLAFSISFGLLVTGCATNVSQDSTIVMRSPSDPSGPSAKEIIHAVLRSSEIPLSIDPSCHGVGSERRDQTIGEFVSGMLAELSDPDMRNFIEVDVSEEMDHEHIHLWRARLSMGQHQGEVWWNWGVEFLIRKSDLVVIPGSFRCLVAG